MSFRRERKFGCVGYVGYCAKEDEHKSKEGEKIPKMYTGL